MPKQAFERRFAFIDDDTLKKNIAIAFEYIIFLIDTASKECHKKLIRSSLYKNMLVYTGSIVEACLAYALCEYIRKGKLQTSQISPAIWKEEAQGIIHTFSKQRQIRYVIEHADYADITNSTNFIDINRACLRGKILNQEEYNVAEEIRMARNKIHVSALKDIDNSYTKEDLDLFFAKANKIITKVEKKLRALVK
ncbi:MAG: hypothetical protein A3C02_01980 [Candidatus Andersenbacteria bacterium RIFCSPHIGHO2_02_FULL_45_11]|uniref:RiboL-PSP-HEPN domain-containing protein n=1 Tax=Candidatus Andersenbacteria bacterium RIFCSPHIGHO2_12_FULL_45_11 TaxID=1797281 RepID=A0A1G1X5L4_9BACT|nr:MAG: hypothetical protein A2805_03120 [Candidatus Andersenbacteria bacterium RIFCSPHIGHO2_01_FULL_46_36]OGY34863.1 MAG: hypothetical protein A3C02_01980 [Candidatus Andersenbacteria bacterium RIFCSPHIGHO2_02_FULL_45_11]OGY35284.1 MAG: hypothetical protein A3D99_04260 [Candidatus Andersenbacteria bacterium RIFCSPHIGHO2_12_FULL_45_11]